MSFRRVPNGTIYGPYPRTTQLAAQGQQLWHILRPKVQGTFDPRARRPALCGRQPGGNQGIWRVGEGPSHWEHLLRMPAGRPITIQRRIDVHAPGELGPHPICARCDAVARTLAPAPDLDAVIED